jgi:hypothetical protein
MFPSSVRKKAIRDAGHLEAQTLRTVEYHKPELIDGHNPQTPQFK